MNDVEIFDFIDKFDDNEKAIILKYMPIRKHTTIQKKDIKIIVLEPLVKHILSIENSTMDIKNLVVECTNLKIKEIENIPTSLFIELRDKIINFNNEDENKDNNELKKK